MKDFYLSSKAPNGAQHTAWTRHKESLHRLSKEEANKYKIIIIGTGLAGASAAATLAEKGFNIDAFSYHESPRRAHSIAAQGGINAAKNYKHDGDSTMRLFYDTIKGGDFRSREQNVYRLAETSANIIDQCVAQGVPFAREYGGLLDNRSFGGAQVSAVLPYDPKKKEIILVQQFRPGTIAKKVDNYLDEIVAGIIEPGESPKTTAKRECLEETGCKVKKLIPIQGYFPAPGSSESFYHLFLAEIDTFDGKRIMGLNQRTRIFL